MSRPSVLACCLILFAGVASDAQVAPPRGEATPPELTRAVDDYVRLYRKDTLAEWKALFLPSFTSTSPRADGGVTVRTLEEFHESQARGFARATTMSESLENVVIQHTGRLATAWADFVFHQDGTSRRGRLVLTLVDTGTAWRIASLLFSY